LYTYFVLKFDFTILTISTSNMLFYFWKLVDSFFCLSS